MRFYLFILVMAFAFLNSCGQRQAPRHNPIDTPVNVIEHIKPVVTATIESSTSDKDETQKLQYGFILKTKVKNSNGKARNYTSLEIWHKNNKIYTDTSQDYKLHNTPYPFLNMIKPNIFELLVQFDNSPSKDLVTFFRIEKDKIIFKKQLPTFDGKPEIINNTLLYHGIWDYGEVWNENGKRYTTYNPQAYYKFTDEGLKLDTTLTILKNKKKYGRFDGLTYKGTIGYLSDERGNITDTTDKNVLRKSSN